ncbi:MAG: hypothetical protein HDR05_03205 [Lachnospiraceae bacterium]|nr:hypothetical protein [Lachnospiraceae bacterium]
MGETSEGLSDEQNEEVTEPSEEDSDEENSEENEDEISDTDTDEEEPSEGDEEDGDENTGDEEEVVDPTTEGEEENVSDATLNATNAEAREALAKPVITVTVADTVIDKNETSVDVPFKNAGNVKFELAKAEGVTADNIEFYYAFDNTPPAVGTNKYNSAVPVNAPTSGAGEVKIRAIAYVPESSDGAGDAQTSAEETFTVNFLEKNKTIVMGVDYKDGTNKEEWTAEVKIGNQEITTSTGYDIEDASKPLDVTVALKPADGKVLTQEITALKYNVPGSTTTKNATVSNEAKKTNGKNGEYTFTIPNTALKTDLELSLNLQTMTEIDAKCADNTSTAFDMFKVTLTSDSPAVNGWEEKTLSAADKVYAPKTAKVTVTVEAVDGHELKSVYWGTAKKALSTDKKKATFTTTVGATNTTLSVEAAEAYGSATIAPKTEGVGSVTKGAKASEWTVAPRAEYTISATMGTGKAFDIADVTLGKTVAGVDVNFVKTSTPDPDPDSDTNPQADEAGVWVLTVGEVKSSQTIPVKLYATKGGTVVETLNVTVTPVTESVTIAGATKSGDKQVLKQVIGRTETYAVTSTAKGSADKFAVKAYTDKTKVDAKINDEGKLEITTAPVEATVDTAAVTIEIINTSATGDNNVVAKLDVITTKPAWDNKTAPTVKLASATDVDLFLSMTLPKGAETKSLPSGTKYYYKVKVTPAAGSTVSEVSGDYRYYEVSGDPATIQQRINAIKKEFGSGANVKFDVEVTLEWYAPTTTTSGGGTGTDEGEPASFTANAASAAPYIGAVVNEGEAVADPDEPTTDPNPTESEDKVSVSDGHIDAVPTGLALIASSKPATLKNAATKTPYHADKITLKKEKAASGVYTGQTIAVATVDFGKDTTYNRDEDVQAWVVNNKDNTDSENTVSVVKNGDLSVVNGKVTLKVGKKVKPGKYKIQVQQTTAGTEKGSLPDNANRATATLDVTVVQGIADISASSQSTIYVPAGKAATAKITTAYNVETKYADKTALAKPKTAKVDYELGTLTNGTDFTPAADGSPIKTWVTVKNGTVTVKKGYDTAATKIENGEFAVKVFAKDYDGNEGTYAVVPFEIVDQPQKLGAIVLVEEKASTPTTPEVPASLDDTKTYVIKASGTPKTAQVISADEAVNLFVGILKDEEGIPSDVGTEVKGDKFVDANLYALTFSKKNDIALTNDGKLDLKSKKPVKDVVVKATATDGGKAKAADLKFTVDYASVDFTKAALEVKVDGKAAAFTGDKTDTLDAKGSTSQVFTLKAVVAGDGSTTEELINKVVDYKITAGKGAKIVRNNRNLDVDIIMTAKEATVNLVGPKGSDGKAQTKPYTITNTAFEDYKAVKTPTVKLAKNQKIYAGFAGTQDITFTIDKGEVPGAKKVVVTAAPDVASQTALGYITDNGKALGELKANAPTDITFTFAANMDVIKKATLYFDFYGEETVNENGSDVTKDVLVAQTSKAISVKTELLKKTYKLTNKYTMSALDKAKVQLKETGKTSGIANLGTQVKFDKILNANLKGTVNHFTEVFELSTASGDNGVLCLKSGADAEKYSDKNYVDPGTKKKLNNLTGFVQYTVTYDDGDPVTYTTQITINLKAKGQFVDKLSAANVKVLQEKNIQATAQVMTGKTPVELAFAKYVANAGNEFFKSEAVGSDNNGAVILKATDADATPDLGKKVGFLYVVPATSLYVGDTDVAKAFSDAAVTPDPDDNTTPATLADVNVLDTLVGEGKVMKVQLTIEVLDPAKTKNKVEIAKTISFEKATETDDAYTVTVPYTLKVVGRVENVTIAQKKDGTPDAPAWVTEVKRADGKNEISIVIDKAAYRKAVIESAKYKDNGAKKTVKVVFNFTADTERKASDQITLNVIPPVIEIKEAPAGMKITVAATGSATSVEVGGTLKFTADVTAADTLTNADKAVTWSVEGAAKDSGTTISNDGTLTVAEGETATELTVKAASVEYPKVVSEGVTITVTPKTETTPTNS